MTGRRRSSWCARPPPCRATPALHSSPSSGVVAAIAEIKGQVRNWCSRAKSRHRPIFTSVAGVQVFLLAAAPALDRPRYWIVVNKVTKWSRSPGCARRTRATPGLSLAARQDSRAITARTGSGDMITLPCARCTPAARRIAAIITLTQQERLIMARERDGSRTKRCGTGVGSCVAALSRGEPDGLVTRRIIAQAAFVLEDYFECSPGIAKALAEDVLRAALRSKNDEARNEAVGSIARGIRALPHLRYSSLVPLYLLET
jgi:hypothetical protein